MRILKKRKKNVLFPLIALIIIQYLILPVSADIIATKSAEKTQISSGGSLNVYLEVENRYLVAGELIIIGDKYGVKITEISTEAKAREV